MSIKTVHIFSMMEMEHLHNLDTYDFYVPPELIAHVPLENRDAARLLVRHDNGTMEHRRVRDLSALLPKQSLVISNNSKVFGSRLIGQLDSGGRVEIFLLEKASGNPATAKAIGRPMRKLRVGRAIRFADGMDATIVDREDREDLPVLSLEFACDALDFHAWTYQHGFVPLPPYIQRPNAKPMGLSEDRDRYQTLFAKDVGSVAAPTAGLHFSESLLQTLQTDHEMAYVTLHVGGGTFLPIRHENVQEHAMHQEHYCVPAETVQAIQTAKAEGRKIIAVGTTALRALESLWRLSQEDGKSLEEIAGQWHDTNLYIYPKTDQLYRPGCVDGLMTNFHQPKSTLLLLVSALIGVTATQDLYREAIGEKYRLFSYGDTSLLWLS